MSMEDLPILPTAIFLPLDQIRVPDRLRPVDEAWIDALASSMDDVGLEHAITVRPVDDGYVLIAGAHRYEAAQKLGWADIAVSVRDIDEEEARLVEIDENLMRRELNALDRGIFLLERKTVHERLNAHTKHGGGSKSQTLRHTLGLSAQRFTKEAAEKTGFSERAIQMAVQVASKLDPEAVSYLRGTSFADNQNALLKLSNETPAKQRTLALQVRDGKAKTLDAARVAAGFQEPSTDDPQARHYATLLETWNKADSATRTTFLKDIASTGWTVPPSLALHGKGSAK